MECPHCNGKMLEYNSEKGTHIYRYCMDCKKAESIKK